MSDAVSAIHPVHKHYRIVLSPVLPSRRVTEHRRPSKIAWKIFGGGYLGNGAYVEKNDRKIDATWIYVLESQIVFSQVINTFDI